jgi:hypothetical protein
MFRIEGKQLNRLLLQVVKHIRILLAEAVIILTIV